MQSLKYRPLRVFVITSQQVSLHCTQRSQKHLKVKVCTRKKQNKKLNITWPKIVFIHVINPNTHPNILVIYSGAEYDHLVTDETVKLAYFPFFL